MLVKINIVVCSLSVRIKLEPYPSKEGRSKPEAVYIHGGASQASPQLRGMRGNQAHACGDYYDAAKALNSVAIKPIRTGMRTALLEAPGRIYKR